MILITAYSVFIRITQVQYGSELTLMGYTVWHQDPMCINCLLKLITVKTNCLLLMRSCVSMRIKWGTFGLEQMVMAYRSITKKKTGLNRLLIYRKYLAISFLI